MATTSPPAPGKSWKSDELTPASQVEMSLIPDHATLFFAFSILPVTKKSLMTPLVLNFDGTVPDPDAVTNVCKSTNDDDVPIKKYWGAFTPFVAITWFPNWVKVTKSISDPNNGVPPEKFVVVNLTVSLEALIKLSLPDAALVTVTIAFDTVAVKSAWALIATFKFDAVVFSFVSTLNRVPDAVLSVDVKTTIELSFFLKVIVLPAPIFP